jgi:hypothetical protein
MDNFLKSVVPVMVIGLLSLVTVVAAENDRDEQVRVVRGTSGTTIKATITGWESVNYKLQARSGQFMTVEMKTSNGSNYFNIYSPGKGPGDAAMFIGSTLGNHYEGTLPTDGEYTVQVFLMRNAARRNENAAYTLKFRFDERKK